jgi:hypothetical protein
VPPKGHFSSSIESAKAFSSCGNVWAGAANFLDMAAPVAASSIAKDLSVLQRTDEAAKAGSTQV